MADPYSRWRHLDGQMVKVHFPVLTEDVDGLPLGVETEEAVAMLVLPAIVDDGVGKP